ncbi:hypothetical protein SDC9_205717 [bioreactor metagenome]|uniref:Uncharacterized protein n=1 Tax=bioreactor metagenome TaxID=1076179 RepID=A0A645J4F4_9ZZZZ
MQVRVLAERSERALDGVHVAHRLAAALAVRKAHRALNLVDDAFDDFVHAHNT